MTMNKKRSKRGGKNKKVKVKREVTGHTSSSFLDPSFFYNRELSWLLFNDRVLSIAGDERTPLLERLKFLNIFINNLNEFYMKRVGGLKEQIVLKQVSISIDNLTAEEQLALIRKKIHKQLIQFESHFSGLILPALNDEGIFLLSWKDLNNHEKSFVTNYFIENIFPILTPLAVDFGHPFPFVSNLSVSLALSMHRPKSKEQIFARVKIPDQLDQWIRVNEGNQTSFRFINISEVILKHLDTLFSGMIIDAVSLFKTTRSAIWDEDDDNAEDLLELVEEGIKDRRFSPVVRLEFESNPNSWIRDYLIDELDLAADDLYEMKTIANYTNFDSIIDLDKPHLKYPPHNPMIPFELQDHLDEEKGKIFQHIRRKDLLVYHPYESFNLTVERFIVEASRDPNTLAIKCTFYRTDKNSRIIEALINAVNAKKQVACVIELKARFDEERNIHWANELVNSGVHVVHGMVGLKTHSKMCIVVRKESDGIITYVHLGTGNYNALTSRTYTDHSYFTCKKEIVSEALEAFNFLTGFSLKTDYKHLLIAPINMKKYFLEMIKSESKFGAKGRIIAKMNQLEDTEIINALYAASSKGVQIDLIIRGFCCLKIGIPGVSENIRVISILGRFLEHSRAFYFSQGKNSPKDGHFYIGSADWMYRNLENRVEIITPITDKNNKLKLWKLLELQLNDYRDVWELSLKGDYKQRRPRNVSESLGGQDRLIAQAYEQRKINVKID